MSDPKAIKLSRLIRGQKSILQAMLEASRAVSTAQEQARLEIRRRRIQQWFMRHNPKSTDEVGSSFQDSSSYDNDQIEEANFVAEIQEKEDKHRRVVHRNEVLLM